MTCPILLLACGAEAASRSIRLRAHVPVFCTLKRVAPYSNVHRGLGRGFGKFKVVCNTPYHVHMEGSWEPPRWPHIPFFPGRHASKDVDVELRVVGGEQALNARCLLAHDRDGGCRAFKDEDGAIPPRLAEAQLTIDTPSAESSRTESGGARDADGHPSAGGESPRSYSAWRWQGRMGLGALTRIASAGDAPYVPRYVHDASRGDEAPATGILDRADAALSGREDEHITVYLTLTGRY
jgi:hypothetical protein